ncbi:MAG: hypothetical protein O3C28_02190 [Proteobacteria bacterium]|nr:hypothetical protein [Pseudomonadota bacterium]
MRMQYLFGTAILTSTMALSSLAGTNEIFEAKTATAGIEVTANDVLSNAPALTTAGFPERHARSMSARKVGCSSAIS